MIARWHVEAKFGHKNESIGLMKEGDQQIAGQTGLDVGRQRMGTGAGGAKESVLETGMRISGLGELGDVFEKLAGVQVPQGRGRKMSEPVVSGSSYWEVFRVID